VFFHLNDTNATQEDVIYANEYFQSLEYEGPVLWPGDLAIWARTPSQTRLGTRRDAHL
jgi:hypothetical protein